MFRPCLLLFLFLSGTLSAQHKDDTRLQWFGDAKLGIFIHWGIYGVKDVSESWSFHNKQIKYSDYMDQRKGFTAAKYDPQYWAALIKSSGARYSVLTTKHHDGVALWDTKMNDLSVPKQTPAARDVLTPFTDALRKEGIKVGTYYSLLDWSHPDYPGFLKDSARYKIADDSARWKRFVKFCHGQIAEVMDLCKPDLIWFDGDWEHSAAEWKAEDVRKMILAKKPTAIINGRLQGFGDYDTPEQNFPVTRPKLPYWELCMTTNDNWGYRESDKKFKTPYEIITIFADCISMGGNMLLDIGPKPDGTIPQEQEYILKELGKWTSKHDEAIFNTVAGMAPGHYYGPSTFSKDSTTIYLFVPGGQTGNIVVKGLNNKILKAEVVGLPIELSPKVVGKISWSPVPGLVYIDIPTGAADTYMTVIKLKLDAPVKLYK